MNENMPAEGVIRENRKGGPTGSGSEADALLESSCRAWPHALARAKLAGQASPVEQKSLAMEVWEGVLRSVSKTVGRGKTAKPVEDLESYLIGTFQRRLKIVLFVARNAGQQPNFHLLTKLRVVRLPLCRVEWQP